MKKILAISVGTIAGGLVALSFQTGDPIIRVRIQEPSENVQFKPYNMDIKEVAVNNLKTPVWFVKTKNPTFSISMKFRNEGHRNFNKNHPAVLNVLLGTLLEGAGDYTASALKEELTYNDISIKVSSDNDDIVVSCYSVAENFDKTVKLLGEILNNAHLTVEKLEVTKQAISEGIKQRQFMPQSIASRELDILSYGEDHPYYVSDEKILADIENHSRRDILAAYKQIFAPKDAEVSIAGNLSEGQIQKSLNELFAELQENKSNDFQPVKQSIDLVGKEQESEKITADPQTLVKFAHPGISSDSKDFYAFKFGLRVLGSGSFSSRFFTEIRDKKGLTYSIGCNLDDCDLSSRIVGSASTRPVNAREMIMAIKEEFNRIKEQGITQEELDYNKTSIISSSTLVSAKDIVKYLDVCRKRGINVGDINSYMKAYHDLTLEQVNMALKEHLDPEKLAFVIVGMRS